MAAKTDKNWTDYFGGKADAANRKILLRIPSGLLSSLTLSTTNGDLLLPALEVTGSLSLSANNGDIRFEKLGVGRLRTGISAAQWPGAMRNFPSPARVKKGRATCLLKRTEHPRR